jgi:hypothetical protein
MVFVALGKEAVSVISRPCSPHERSDMREGPPMSLAVRAFVQPPPYPGYALRWLSSSKSSIRPQIQGAADALRDSAMKRVGLVQRARHDRAVQDFNQRFEFYWIAVVIDND